MINTRFFLSTAIGMLLFLSASFACDTTPTQMAQNIQYAGEGLYSIDIQNCIGDAGSISGFTISVSDVNIVGFSPDTIQNVFNDNIAIGTLSNGMLEYIYIGLGYFVEAAQNSCFSSTITVDAYPEEATITFTGVNTPGGCSILYGDTQTTPVVETPACGNIFYDTGGANSPYGNNENYHVVICGGSGPVRLNFIEFQLAEDGDIMTIYDNDQTSGSSNFYTGMNGPSIVTSTNPSNCLTVAFESNSFGEEASGWAAEVICEAMPCNDLDVYITGNLPLSGEGEAQAIVSGGDIPYTFDWSTGENTYNTDIPGEGTYSVTVEDNSGCIAVDTIMLMTGDSIVSIIQPEDCTSNFENCPSKFGLTDISPNPAHENIYVSFEVPDNRETIQVQLIDVMGRILKEQQITPDIGSNQTLIDVSNLETAIYFIVINDGEQQSVKKFLKR